MVSVDRMHISILFVLVEALEMSCAVVAETLAPQADDLLSSKIAELKIALDNFTKTNSCS